MVRPKSFTEYVGQDRIKSLLRAEILAGQPRHMLLTGPPGLGKTSLAAVVAAEAGLQFVHLQAGPQLTSQKLTRELFGLDVKGYGTRGEFKAGICKQFLVFIDEIHLLPDFETPLYNTLEDRILNPDPMGGVSWLPHITFVGATTNKNALPKPFIDRFPLDLRLEPYNTSDLALMVRNAFPALSYADIDCITKRSRGTARIALNFAESVVRHGLGYFDSMEIDDKGLTRIDRRVLEALDNAGRPLSLNSLAAMVRENPATLRDNVEPYLLECGLMEITPRGRISVKFAAAEMSRGYAL